jgi:1-acyl-sn-glycerol-3-phosphate acyltransferase
VNAPDRPVADEQQALRLIETIAELMRDTQPAAAAHRTPTLDSSLERDLGFDSLARVELFLRIERAFDVRLPDHLLGAAETPRDLLRAVTAGSRRSVEALVAIPVVLPEAASAQLPEQATTLIEALDWHVAAHPDRMHVLVLGEEDDGVPMTYAQLRAEGLRVAAGFAALGIGGGQAVAIMLPTGRDFFLAFVGILLAGAVPVPIYPPARIAQLEEHLRRQSRILGNCRATALVTVPEALRVARMVQDLVPTLATVATVQELSRPVAGAALPVARATDIAFLQYTSGSTGDPKGVVLTHANLLANIRAMAPVARADANDIFVSWLPLYHDMGLIGAWMGGLYVGFPLVVMSPVAFLNRPSRWLRALHRYRATITAAPNFAWEICAARIDERDLAGLDLASLRLAFNGAEPVSPDTLARFADRFARFGFRREAFTPVYGLAECAVGLAFPPIGRGPLIDRVDRRSLALSGQASPAQPGDTEAHRFVSCGSPLPGYEIRIVSPDGRELSERMEGRIEFRGPSATSGYFRNAEATRSLFDGDWLDTGDLGYLAGGELFVTSRAKDVIIRGGQHVHPYELEEAVGNLPGARKGCVAVFGVPDEASGTEKVVVLAETRLAPGAAREALRAAIADASLALLGTPVDDIVLAPPHTVLKTSSGKIRRAASRDVYSRGLAATGRPAAWRALARFVGSLALARARRAARMAAHLLYGTYLWLLAALLGTVGVLAALLPRPQWRWRVLHSLARTLLGASGLPRAVHGLENIPASGPAVVVANHASYLDGPLLFALLPPRSRFVAKRELSANPVLRFLLLAAGARFVERFDAGRGAEDTRELVRLAREGELLVFFAEGTFTRAPGLLPFHMGPFVVSAESGAPVVPVTLRGTRSVLREGQHLVRRGAIRVSIGAPQEPAGSDWRSAARLRESVRAEILAQCGEPDLHQRT